MAAPAASVRPKLADVYFDWQAEGRTTTPPSIGGIVAVAQTSDWGPVNVCTLLESEDELYGFFGQSDTNLHRAVRDAFKGQQVNGKGGASAVLVERQATSSAAKGAKTLQNTAGTPANAVTLTAKYPGTRGNALRLTVQAAATVGNAQLVVLDGALVVETYEYAEADIASLVASVNLSSDWFDAALLVTGTKLATVSAVAVTGGNDGASLTGTEWTATFAAFDRERWSIFAPYGLTDSTIRASLVAWIKQRNALGARSFAAFGGASGESMSTATARSVAINDWDIINLGRGTLHLTEDDRDVSTAEFVARYAGARAWRGESRDDIYVRFGGVELVDGPTLSEQEQALDGGTVVFSRDTNVAAPVFIREGVTTYTDDSQSPVDAQGNKTKPAALYKRIKNIAIQHAIELEVADWARAGGVLGDMPVTEKSRELILGRVKIAYQTRETAEIVNPGWTVVVDGPTADTDDFVAYLHGFHPTRSLRQIFNLVRLG
jgi:hypothetical protein